LSSSPAGRVLAETIASRLGLPVGARATPMLLETRAPAVVVATDLLTSATGKTIAAEIIELFLHGVPQENSAR
ncbi:MAG: hypothetical protein V3W06_07620, partial [Acidimicrobiia bacterium]